MHSVFQRHITHKPHACDCINMLCYRYNYIPVSTGAVGSVLYLSTMYSASVSGNNFLWVELHGKYSNSYGPQTPEVLRHTKPTLTVTLLPTDSYLQWCSGQAHLRS